MEFWTVMLTGGPHGWFAAIAALTALAAFGIVAGAPGAEGAAPVDGAEPVEGAEPVTDDVVDDAVAGAEGERQAGAEDDEDEDADLPPEVRDDPKRLRTRHRRLQRQHSTVAPIAERFRGPDGRYLQLDEVDRIRGRARDMERLEELFDANPDLRDQVLERHAGRRPAAAEPTEEQWADPYTTAALETLPFDPANPSSQWFLNEFRRLDKQNHELRTSLKKVEQGVGTVTQRDAQRAEAQIEDAWKTQTLEAAKAAGLRGDDLADFVDIVYTKFRAGKAERRLEKIDRKQIIERALGPFKRGRTAGSRQATVAAATRVDANRRQPAPHNRAAASPASPQATNTVGTIKDGRKSFFARQGMTAPPGR